MNSRPLLQEIASLPSCSAMRKSGSLSSVILEYDYVVLLSVLTCFKLWSCRVLNSLQLSIRSLPREWLLNGWWCPGRVNKGQRVALSPVPFVALCCNLRALLTLFNGVFAFSPNQKIEVWNYKYHEMSMSPSDLD